MATGKGISRMALAVGFATLLLLTSVIVDVKLRPNSASAKLFQADEKEAAAAEPFWKDNTDIDTDTEVMANPPQGAPMSFADLAEKVSPAVVNIKTSKTITRRGSDFFPFEGFFGPHSGMAPREEVVPSLGSGFVIAEDGYIVTNNHVIEDVDSIHVVFLDGTELEGEVIGRDPKTDIALLRVDSDKPLTALPLGDSDVMRPGDWVIAIGNPFGLNHTVTAGIISAKGRIIGAGPYDNFIQTDTAINPGNSGGPLINLAGEVIGINTAINPRANTIGFAVPISMAKNILPQLRASGHVTRGWLGVVIQPLTPELAESFGLDETDGALVNGLSPGGPAAKSGLEIGDIITSFDGEPIDRMEDLPRIVADAGVGSKVEVVVLRDGKEKALTVTIGELEDETLAEAPPAEGSDLEELGLRAQPLTPELAEQLGAMEEYGIVVADVAMGSPAAKVGLQRGDILLEANRKPLNSVSELVEEVNRSEKGALLLVQRGGVTVFVALKP